jgi:hypothetical protein
MPLLDIPSQYYGYYNGIMISVWFDDGKTINYCNNIG